MHLITQKSERIIREYKQLYKDYQKVNNQQLQELLNPAKPTEKKEYGNPMSKTLTKTEIHLKKLRCINDKSLKQLLLYCFLNHYGYDNGEITAKAIITDVLQLIEDCFILSTKPDDNLHLLNYGQLTWMAVPIDECPQRGKSIASTRMKPIILSFISDEDVAHIAHGFDLTSL